MDAALKPLFISVRLLEAREAARTLGGERYAGKIAEHRGYIEAVMAKHKCEALPAMMALVTELKKQDPHGSGYAQMWLFAALVEKLENPEEQG